MHKKMQISSSITLLRLSAIFELYLHTITIMNPSVLRIPIESGQTYALAQKTKRIFGRWLWNAQRWARYGNESSRQSISRHEKWIISDEIIMTIWGKYRTQNVNIGFPHHFFAKAFYPLGCSDSGHLKCQTN